MDYETCVAAIRADVAEILAMELDCTHDDVSLFDLGLNSLIALELGARLRDLHGLEVSSSTLFDARTIKDLADLVVAADRGRR
ncbi:acyl carrier protein [Streptomyces chartreusis]